MENVSEKLEGLIKKQRQLEADIAGINREAVGLRRVIAKDESHDLLSNLRLLGNELVKGEVANLWEKIQGNMVTLKQNDEKFFNSISDRANPFGLKFEDESERLFFTNLIGNCLMKSGNDFQKFLTHIGNKKAGGFFFKEVK